MGKSRNIIESGCVCDDDEDGDGDVTMTSNGVVEHTTTKDQPINVSSYCNFFLSQIILRDEPCSHSNTKCVTKQKRCSDEMETVIITCLSCGRVQNK